MRLIASTDSYLICFQGLSVRRVPSTMDCYLSKLDPSIPSPQKMKLDLEQVIIKMIMKIIIMTIKSMTMAMTVPSMKVYFRKKWDNLHTTIGAVCLQVSKDNYFCYYRFFIFLGIAANPSRQGNGKENYDTSVGSCNSLAVATEDFGFLWKFSNIQSWRNSIGLIGECNLSQDRVAR